MEYVNVVCERGMWNIHIPTIHIQNDHIFGVATYSNGIQISKEYIPIPNGYISNSVLKVVIEIERLQMVVTSEVGERHVNDEEGSWTHDIVGVNDNVIPLSQARRNIDYNVY